MAEQTPRNPIRRELTIGLIVVTVMTASWQVGTRVIGRRMLFTQCAKDKGVVVDEGFFGTLSCHLTH